MFYPFCRNVFDGIIFSTTKFVLNNFFLSSIKNLAGQTMWYGVSSIFARFLNYLLTPYLTLKLSGVDYGEMSLVYSVIPFLNVIFSYGLETTYFRFIQNKENEKNIYDTATVSLIISTISLTTLLIIFRDSVAGLIGLSEFPEYITWSALIIAFDALGTLAFARLRHEGRPVKFAFIRITGILTNIAAIYFFLSVCPQIKQSNPGSFLLIFYNENMEVGYIIIANLVQAILTFLLLRKEFFSFRWQFNVKLWKEMMLYTLPLIIAGFGGMINETLDRIMLVWWSTAGTPDEVKLQVGTYSANYKLAIIITLFIQAFRMGAEPFFFKQYGQENAQKTYARVMKFFVIIVCGMFLAVVLFLDVWKYFIQNPQMWEGLKVVPVLLLANIFLGIYYNLSIWYKITNKTMTGAWITLAGSAITLFINFLFIPKYGYMACAWATFFCYGSMMVISFVLGQKHYNIPYAWKKLLAYLTISVILYGLHSLLILFNESKLINHTAGIVAISLFAAMILKVERKEFASFPYIGKLFNSKN